MRLLGSIDVSASGLTAQRLRMDVIANNLANVNTTRSGHTDADGTPIPYRRQSVVFASRYDEPNSFSTALEKATGNPTYQGSGVRVVNIVEDATPFKMEYDPEHPDAIRTGPQAGYVRLPNVNTVKEMIDMISSSRAYEANITAVNAAKALAAKALEIGRG